MAPWSASSSGNANHCACAHSSRDLPLKFAVTPFCQALPGLDRSHANAVGATILENSGSDNELRAAVAGRRSGAPDAGRYEYGGRRRSPVLPCKSATVKHLPVWGRSPNGRLLVTVWPRYGSALQAGVCKSPRSMGPHGGRVMTRILSDFLLFSCLVMFAWGVGLAAVTLLS